VGWGGAGGAGSAGGRCMPPAAQPGPPEKGPRPGPDAALPGKPAALPFCLGCGFLLQAQLLLLLQVLTLLGLGLGLPLCGGRLVCAGFAQLRMGRPVAPVPAFGLLPACVGERTAAVLAAGPPGFPFNSRPRSVQSSLVNTPT
jgi:hypothetical protein